MEMRCSCGCLPGQDSGVSQSDLRGWFSSGTLHWTEHPLVLHWSSSDSPVFSGVTLILLSPCSKHLSFNTSTQRLLPQPRISHTQP